MKAVSIHNPWCWAILHAGKNVENRSWATRHHGPLLVHAALSLKSLDAQRAAHWRAAFGVELPRREALVFGALLGTVDVIDCVQVGPGGAIGTHGHSKWAEHGYYGWVLANPKPFAEPIPYRGAQLLFEVPDEVLPVDLRAAG